MANFFVTDKYWQAALVDGQPLDCGGESIDNYCYASTVLTFKPHVEVDFDEMGDYDHLTWLIGYHDASGVRNVLQGASVPPGPITVVVPGNDYFAGAPIPHPLSVQLYGCLGEEQPPDGDRLLIATIMEAATFFDPNVAAPTRYRPGGEWRCAACPAGGTTCDLSELIRIATDYGYGNFAAFFDIPVYPVGDPNAIWTAFTYTRTPAGSQWVFSALPGDMSFAQQCTTLESPPRPAYFAGTRPASGGSTRVYLSDNAAGGFVPEVDYGASFSPREDGYSEQIGSAVVYYDDTYKRIQRVIDGGAVHEYDYASTSEVVITANTEPLTRMICTHSSYRVTRVETEAFIPLFGGWVPIGAADISWSDDVISTIALSPNGTTTSFRYYEDGTLAKLEAGDGTTCEFQYYEEEGA